MKLKIESITSDESMQLRAGLNEPVISEYEEAMREGAVFPPVIIWVSDGVYLLIDGFHRVEAAKRCGFLEIEAIEAGSTTKVQALCEAATSNAYHGLRFTSADKRNAIAKLLRASPDSSNSAVAKLLSVSSHTVESVRSSEGLGVAMVKGRDNKMYPAKVKREPRPGQQDQDEGDRDDEEDTAPPPDTGMGGDAASPEELAKSEKRRAPKSEILDYCDMVIKDLTEGGYEASASAMMTVKAWVKG